MLEDIAKNINILGEFCAKRDIAELTSEQLDEKYQICWNCFAIMEYHFAASSFRRMPPCNIVWKQG